MSTYAAYKYKGLCERDLNYETTNITFYQILKMLLCGKKGLDREVKGIRIIEIEDMEQYLTGGEMLITSFQVYLSCSDREVEQHFEDLVKSDISGFIVKKREEDDPTGKRLKLLEKHCEKYEIPLLEIPEDLYYWGIIRYVMTQVFDKDTARFLFQSMSLCTEQRKERGEHLCSLQIQRIMRARSKLTWRYKHEWDTQ